MIFARIFAHFMKYLLLLWLAAVVGYDCYCYTITAIISSLQSMSFSFCGSMTKV